MTIYRHDQTLTGQRPGARDAPQDTRTDRQVAAELRALERQRDREARRANPAYGSLNMDDWSEATLTARLVPPGGRPKKERHRVKALDDDEITRNFG